MNEQDTAVQAQPAAAKATRHKDPPKTSYAQIGAACKEASGLLGCTVTYSRQVGEGHSIDLIAADGGMSRPRMSLSREGCIDYLDGLCFGIQLERKRAKAQEAQEEGYAE